MSNQSILLAVTGMSPAILTETIWALAHPGSEDDELPVIPDRLVVVTTTIGRDSIIRELLTPIPEPKDSNSESITVWQSLRLRLAQAGHDVEGKLSFGPTSDNIRVFTNVNPVSEQTEELEDIRTAEENDAAANFLLEQVRQFTENPETQLIGSIAGGRKTMGALLYAMMSLLGRSQDRLTHVLVNSPFDHPGLSPKFYFPAAEPQIHQLLDRDSKPISEHSSKNAELSLGEMPFVRLKHLFQRDFNKIPGHFRSLVEFGTSATRRSVGQGPPTVTILPVEQAIVVNQSEPITIPNPKHFAYYAFLYHQAIIGEPPYSRITDAYDDFRSWLPSWCESMPDSLAKLRYLHLDWEFTGAMNFADEFRRYRNALKNLLLKSLPNAVDLEPDLLPKKSLFGIQIAAEEAAGSS